MSLFPQRIETIVFVSGVLLGAPAALCAQQARMLQAQHRSGQTFLTWTEITTPGATYRVYRSAAQIRDANDLARADRLGEVDEKSSWNAGRSYALEREANWIIADGGAELADDQGLFVYTVEGARGGQVRAYYAVTAVVAGVENTTLKPGTNSTPAVLETPAPPQPVVQGTGPQGSVWAHWVGNRDTAYQPALSFLPSHGFDFLFEPGSAPPPRGLLLRLHAAGQDYAQGWPHRNEVPPDVDILSPNDLYPRAGWTFWLGLREGFPSPSAPQELVDGFTLARVRRTLDWIAAHQGADHDPGRVYVVGGSMGAMGAMYLASELPQRFAAILCRNGNYDLAAPDLGNPAVLERVFGSFAYDLPTSSGLSILERTNGAFMANLDAGADWPVIRTINGRNDSIVGWSSAVELFEGLARACRPAVHYFDTRDHEPQGYWQGVEHALLQRTFRTRLDRPALCIGECTLDDDPGDGDPLQGDSIGTLNGYVDYDPATATAGAGFAQFEVYLRAEGALDDASRSRGWARLTPRRLGAFGQDPGEAVHFTLKEEEDLVDEHLLFPDGHGLVHTPLAPLSVRPRTALFERWTPPGRPYLFLGDAPLKGDRLQAVLFGRPAEPWSLLLALGDEDGPWAVRPGRKPTRLQGVLDDAGRADLSLPLPGWVPPGSQLVGQAWIGGQPTPRASVRVQPSH